MPSKPYEALYLHCSASEFGHSFMIDEWHRARGWKKIGYGEVVLNGYPSSGYFKDNILVPYLEGSVEIGRLIDEDDQFEDFEKQAGIFGHNTGSHHICMIGNKTFSNKVRNTALRVMWFRSQQLKVQIDHIKGHCEMDTKKPFCPGIDMVEFRQMLMNKRQYGDKTIVEVLKPEPPKRELNLSIVIKFFKSILNRKGK